MVFAKAWIQRCALAMLVVATATGVAPAQQVRPGVGFPSALPLKDRIDIVNAAGYQITPDGRSVFVYCGDTKMPNRPVVAQIDVNGDGKTEYMVLGERKCPGEPPVPITADIVMRDARGIWQNILSVHGSPKWADGTTNGWRNLTIVQGARATAYVHDVEGQRYANASDLEARKNLALPASPTRTAAGVVPTAGWTAPYSMGAISPGDLAAILTAAGYKRIRGKWTGCDGVSEVHIFGEDQLAGDGPVIDLNGDGRPEVMVYDESDQCYGNVGMHFNIVTPVPGGWKLIFASGEGMPLVQDSKNAAGWRDVVAGGPGFCHSLYRFNGRVYADFRSYEETKGACSQ
ncbi:hypothetical protein [Flavisphingomonas formosensis]|uniref:hypothetical protein n=1 Tax=Flavisphingomonas formosensis TaxID=861534 RepID=UPI0012FCBBB4|nr:hypothetical protein [Sphingomonas formosensis]